MNRPRLWQFERAWADAAFETFFPSTPELPHGAPLDAAAFFDDVVTHRTPLKQSVGVRLALWLVGLAPLFVIGRLATFAALDREARARVLEKLLGSSLYAVRQLALALKAMGAMLYAQAPAARERMLAPARESAALTWITLRRRTAKNDNAREEREHAAE